MKNGRTIDNPNGTGERSVRPLAENECRIEDWRSPGLGAISDAEVVMTEYLKLSVLELIRVQRAALLRVQAGAGNGHCEPDC